MYVVTQVFENAVEVWDEKTVDEWMKPVPITINLPREHGFEKGDDVQILLKKTSLKLSETVTIPIRFDPDCPPGQLYMVNKNSPPPELEAYLKRGENI